MNSDDPRVSDEATGLPALDELGDDPAVLVLAWATGEGLVSSPASGAVEACVFLHVRGLVPGELGPGSADWAQAHLAIPRDELEQVLASLRAAADQ